MSLARTLLLLALLLPAAARATPSLSELVERLSADELRRATFPGCRWTERTTIIELDGDGRALGREHRTSASEQRGNEAPTRIRLTTVAEGERLSLPLRGDGDDDASPRRGPFHPELRADYRYRLLEGLPLKVAFEPLEPGPERVRGEVRLDAAGELFSMTIAPTKLRLMLDALEIRMEFGPTPCERRPTRVWARGHGGFAFYRIRFRSETTLVDFAPLR